MSTSKLAGAAAGAGGENADSNKSQRTSGNSHLGQLSYNSHDLAGQSHGRRTIAI